MSLFPPSSLSEYAADTWRDRNFQVSLTNAAAAVCSATELEGMDVGPVSLVETDMVEKMGSDGPPNRRRIVNTALVG